MTPPGRSRARASTRAQISSADCSCTRRAYITCLRVGSPAGSPDTGRKDDRTMRNAIGWGISGIPVAWWMSLGVAQAQTPPPAPATLPTPPAAAGPPAAPGTPAADDTAPLPVPAELSVINDRGIT